MVQWMNVQRIKGFANPMQLYITCKRSEGLHLAELGLMPGYLTDKIWERLKI